MGVLIVAACRGIYAFYMAKNRSFWPLFPVGLPTSYCEELVLRIMAKTSPAQFVRQVRQEIGRISWAGRRETGLATITVFIMASIAAIFFLLVDMVFSNAIQFILGMFG